MRSLSLSHLKKVDKNTMTFAREIQNAVEPHDDSDWLNCASVAVETAPTEAKTLSRLEGIECETKTSTFGRGDQNKIKTFILKKNNNKTNKNYPYLFFNSNLLLYRSVFSLNHFPALPTISNHFQKIHKIETNKPYKDQPQALQPYTVASWSSWQELWKPNKSKLHSASVEATNEK